MTLFKVIQGLAVYQVVFYAEIYDVEVRARA